MIAQPELAALREIITSLSAGVFFTRQGSQAMELMFANAAFEQMCGYSFAELRGRDLTILCPARATLAEFQQFQAISGAKEQARTRLRCQRKDSAQVWLDVMLSPVAFRFQGQPVECMGLVQDATALFETELALKQSATQQQLILDGIGSPVLGLTAEMQVKFCNKAYGEFVGRNIDELVGNNLVEMFPSFRQRRTYAVYQQVLASGQAQALEGQMFDRYFRAMVYPTPWGILAIAEDYTDRRQFEDELINRDRLLLGFAQASVLLAGGARDTRLINLALAELGKSAHVDRVYLVELHHEEGVATLLSSQRYEWNREGLSEQAALPALPGINLVDKLPRWHQSFQRGAPVYGQLQHLPEEEQQALAGYGAVSLLIVPIMIHRKLWGLIGFDDFTQPREWRQSEIGVLLAAAASVGSAIAHQDAEARLLQERTLLQQVIDSIPDLVSYKDRDSVYMGCNTAFTRFAGRARDSIIGHSDVELFPALEAGRFFDSDRHALATGGPRHEEEWVAYPDGHRVLLDTLKLPFCDPAGVVIGVLGVSRNITEKRRTEQVQREFVDNVSHELRTPITALLGLAETLQRSGLDEDQRSQLLGKIGTQSLRLARLVDDILALSNLELAEQTMRRDRVDLRQICRAAYDALHTSAEDKRLACSVELQEEPAELVGDATLLELLVTNLFSNAIRYTPPDGTIRLSVKTEPERVLVEVADTGIGIEPGHQERIFERFYRADKARSRAEGGTGLGLAIVNQVAGLHAGEVKVASKLGHGSTFTAAFPRLRS
jgi:PAS domain S-box-containing protein